MNEYYMRSTNGWIHLQSHTLEEFKTCYAEGDSLSRLTNLINYRAWYDETDKKEVQKLIAKIRRTPEGEDLYQKRCDVLHKEKMKRCKKETGTWYKHICPFCHEEYTTDNSRRVYCSKACQLEMHKKTRLENKPPKLERTYTHIEKKEPELILQGRRYTFLRYGFFRAVF